MQLHIHSRVRGRSLLLGLVAAAIVTQNHAAASVHLSGLKSLPAFTLGFVASTSVGPVQSDLLSLRGEGRGLGGESERKGV